MYAHFIILYNIYIYTSITCALVEESLVCPCVSQVGLAVDDTKAIQEQAQIQRLSQQVCVWWGPLILDVRGSMHVCIHAYMPVYMCI